jgi:hypothetical protein
VPTNATPSIMNDPVPDDANDAHEVDALKRQLADIVHVSVGFGILAFQKAQVLRRELETELARRFPKPKP